jgi:hypothetical protein
VRAGGGPAPSRRAPSLIWDDPRVAPKTGSFAPNALANDALRAGAVPGEADGWDRLEEFALSYDGYAYWDGLPELAQKHVSAWTRDGSLPATLDEQRACLFYEQRRWHHFGDVPSGRSLDYLWALATAIRAGLAPVRVEPAPSAPVSFLDDDAGFLAWLAQHPEGMVLNVERRSARHARLHRAGCPTLAGGAGKTWTLSYRKVCGTDRGALEAWTRDEAGGDPDPCKRCKP